MALMDIWLNGSMYWGARSLFFFAQKKLRNANKTCQENRRDPNQQSAEHNKVAL
jgi:hypothetical protein